MSKRITDEKFVLELEGDRRRRSSLDSGFDRLEELVEKEDAEILTSPKGKLRSALKRMLFRLLRPAIAPFIHHQRQIERERLRLLRELWSQADERLTSAENRLLQLYVKAGESMAELRESLLAGMEKRISGAREDLRRQASDTILAESERLRERLGDESRRHAAALVGRTDMMLSHLEAEVAALQHDLERHTRLSSKRLEGCAGEITRLRQGVEAVRERTRLIAREMAPGPRSPGPDQVAGTDALSPEEYAAHLERFRGSPEEIARRQRLYVDYFQGCEPVLDVGCGRGEFLELLAGAGINSYGIEINRKLVAACKKKGLEVVRADLTSHLGELDEGSLGGIFAAQVVEHLDWPQLRAFLTQGYRALRRGGVMIAETLNPESVYALTRFFYLDATHKAPLPPMLLQFLAELAGFSRVEIKHLSELPEEERLQKVELETVVPAALEAAFKKLNSNIDKLNDLLYGRMEYAVIARK